MRLLGGVPGHRAGDADWFERFWHDADVTWFETQNGRAILLGLAAGVGVLAFLFGPAVAAPLAALVAAGLAISIVLIERDRWRAQDVLVWFQAQRRRRWLVDTGTEGPDLPEEADPWLYAHPAGSVPQIYRAITVTNFGDDRQAELEVAAMDDGNAVERAWRTYVVEGPRFLTSGRADVSAVVEALPAMSSEDRFSLVPWLAMVESARRYAELDASWLEPLLDCWPTVPHLPIGFRRSRRLWLSRFFAVGIFGGTAVLAIAFGLRLRD